MADDKDPMPKIELDTEAKDLLLDQTKAEARQAIAEARKATTAASTVPLPTELPQASLDAGDAGSVVAAVEAFAVLKDASTDIASAIHDDLENPDPPPTVLLVKSLDVATGHGVYRAVDAQLAQLEQIVERASRLLPEAEPSILAEQRKSTGLEGANFRLAGPVIASTVAGVAAGALPLLLAAFKTDVTIRNREVQVQQGATFAALARALNHHGYSVQLEAMRGPQDQNPLIARVNALATRRMKLVEQQLTVQINIVEGPAAIDLAQATERLKARREELSKATTEAARRRLRRQIETASGQVTEALGIVNAASYQVAIAKEAIQAIDTFLAQLFSASETQSAPIVTAAVHQELSAEENLYLLFAETVQTGGETILKTRWRTGLEKAHHIGGVSVAWVLSNRAGEIASSGLQTRLGTVTTDGDSAVQEPSSTVVLGTALGQTRRKRRVSAS